MTQGSASMKELALVSFMVLKALDFRNQENPTEEKREKSF
jgi:hypothetical protein